MSEEKVGGLVIWRGVPADGEPYRDLRDGDLEIRQGSGAIASAETGPGRMMLLVMILGGLLLTFAVVVRSIPAMATVGAALVALTWLVVYRKRRSVAAGRVVLGAEGIRIETPTERVVTELSDVQALGVGEDGALHTLWIQIREHGRVLVFDGLEKDEARKAEGALTEAIERRRAG